MLRWIGISTSKFHNWKQRYGKVNEHNAWVPRDHWLTNDERERICQFARQNPLEGYRLLTFMMLDADVVAASPSSVYRVLQRAGLLAGTSPKPSKKGTGFVQPIQPHEHWHIDVTYINIAGTFYFLCSILDGFSRAILHWDIGPSMTEQEVEIVVQRARECHPGVTPRIISDNGSQFIARDFKEFVRVTGMTHVKTSPYYPQSNGKIERWHKTLKGECIRVLTPLSLDDARRLLTDYVDHYNNVRLHGAIGYISPRSMLDGKAKEIHAERDRKLDEARQRRAQVRQSTHEEKNQAGHTARPSIDFAALRAAVPMAEVLTLLGWKPASSQRGQQRGTCPLHGSSRGTARCFSVNLNDNHFHCFKCGATGNALDLWAKATKQTIYDAALDLCQRLNLPLPRLTEPSNRTNREEEPVDSGPRPV